MLAIEREFELPVGYIDAQGTIHRHGVMRRATALDEVEALAHPRVRASEAYASILLLSRVLVRLGALSPVPVAVVEGLFATDFLYLQDMYLLLNAATGAYETQCPRCGARFALDMSHEHIAE